MTKAQMTPTATSSAPQADKDERGFPILDLLPELRKQIYYLAIERFAVIDTAAIQDKVVTPSIAQASRQLRNEALAVFLRNRPVEISFHCALNVRRAKMWANSWAGHAEGFSTIAFSGVMQATGYEFFHITVKSLKTAPYFIVTSRPGVSKSGVPVIGRLEDKMNKRLRRFCRNANDYEQQRLTAARLGELIDEVEMEAAK